MRIFFARISKFRKFAKICEFLRKFAKICESLRIFAINLFIKLQCFSGFGSVTVTVAWQIFEYYEEWLGQTMDTFINFFPMHIFQYKFKVGEYFLKESDFEVKFFILVFNLKKNRFDLWEKLNIFQKWVCLLNCTFFNFHPLNSSETSFFENIWFFPNRIIIFDLTFFTPKKWQNSYI